MNTNTIHKDFIFSIKFELGWFWALAVATMVSAVIVMFILFAKREAE